jgi:DNA helicase-2/ATP-dependent DNA helicase PcrA
LSRISHAKNRMEGPESFAANSWNPKEGTNRQVVRDLRAAPEGANALDFDDLLLRTVELFDKAPAVRERYAQQVQVRDGGRVPRTPTALSTC